MELNKKTEGIKLIAYLLFAIILLCVVFGCAGARKVDKSETKETVKETEQTTEVTKTDVSNNTKIVDTSISDEFEIIPIDNSKPIIVNGKSFLNVKIKQSKVKRSVSTDNSLKVSKNEQKASNKAFNKTKSVEQKQSDKKQFNFLNLWWILPLIVICYFSYRKFKGLPLV